MLVGQTLPAARNNLDFQETKLNTILQKYLREENNNKMKTKDYLMNRIKDIVTIIRNSDLGENKNDEQ